MEGNNVKKGEVSRRGKVLGRGIVSNYEEGLSIREGYIMKENVKF